MKNFLKNFSFMGMLMFMLCVILGVGGMTGVAFANGVATGIATGGKADNGGAQADAQGMSLEHGFHGALETTDIRALRPEMINDPVDQNLVKIRPNVSPLDTILRYAGSKPTNNFEYEWYSIGTRAVDDKTSGTATITSNADPQLVQAVITVAGNVNKFDVTDTILFPTIKGADNEALVGYVVEKDVKNKQLTITVAEEQMTDGGSGSKTIPAIAAGTAIYSLGRAAGELDVKTPAISYIPKPSRGYCQIFMAQIAQSTYEKMMDKKFKFDVSEIEEQALYEYRVRMEGSFLFGKKGKVYNPNTNSYVYMTGGITRQIGRKEELDVTKGDAELIRVMKEIFTGNSGAKERVLLAGSEFVEKMSTFNTVQKQLEAGNTEVVWGITWKKIESNFGTLLLVQHELLNQYGWSDKAIVLDPQYLKKWQISNFERKEYDGKELAIMNGNFTVFREVCGVAVYNPDAHYILTLKNA